LTSGYQLAFGIGAGLVVVAIALAAFVLRPPAAEPAEADAVVQVAAGEVAYSEAA